MGSESSFIDSALHDHGEMVDGGGAPGKVEGRMKELN